MGMEFFPQCQKFLGHTELFPSAARRLALYIGWAGTGDLSILSAGISRFQGMQKLRHENLRHRRHGSQHLRHSCKSRLQLHPAQDVRLPAAAYGYAAGGCGADAANLLAIKNHVIAYAKVKAAGFPWFPRHPLQRQLGRPNSQIFPPSLWWNASTFDARSLIPLRPLRPCQQPEISGRLPDMVRQDRNEVTNGFADLAPQAAHVNCTQTV